MVDGLDDLQSIESQIRKEGSAQVALECRGVSEILELVCPSNIGAFQ